MRATNQISDSSVPSPFPLPLQALLSAAMAGGRVSIFEGANIKPGVYKIQNLSTETYLDIHLHSMELCCRPPNDLGVGRGLVCPPCVPFVII